MKGASGTLARQTNGVLKRIEEAYGWPDEYRNLWQNGRAALPASAARVGAFLSRTPMAGSCRSPRTRAGFTCAR